MRFLEADFFARATIEVARDLLGATLRVRDRDGGWTAGRIVETEAYGGTDDPASHAGRGRTPRSEIMFGPPGCAYVYLIYGVHHCLNFVTEVEGVAGAVLIRALEPLVGEDKMVLRRGLDPRKFRARELCSGPGKLCCALGVDLSWNGQRLAGQPANQRVAQDRLMAVEASGKSVVWQSSPRIGITRATGRLHRFIDPASDCVSR